MAAGNAGIRQEALLIRGLRGLGDDIFILHIGGHIFHFVGEPAGLLVHLAVRGLDEAVAVDAGIGGQVGNKTDVGAFRGLNGAQAAVVTVVNVADVKGGPVTRQAAGTQGRHTALVGQLGQGIGLIHELGERARAEELLDGSGDGADIDQGLGRNNIQVLDGHTLPDDPLHTGEADAELILEQFSYRTQAAVPQVVDIVGASHAKGQAVEIVDGGHHIVHNDVLGDQIIDAVPDDLLQFLALILLQQLHQHAVADLLGNPALFRIKIHELGHIHHVIGEYFYLPPLHIDDSLVHAAVIQLAGALPGQNLAGFGNDLSGAGVGYGQRQRLPRQPGPDRQLFIKLVAAHSRQVVAPRVKEEGV